MAEIKKKEKAHNNKVDSFPKAIQDKIYDLRENKSFSHNQIAKELNLSPFLIGKYCRKYIDNEPLPLPVDNAKNTNVMRRKMNPQYSQEEINNILIEIYDNRFIF